MSQLPSFRQYTKNNLQIELKILKAEQLASETKDWIFGLLGQGSLNENPLVIITNALPTEARQKGNSNTAPDQSRSGRSPKKSNLRTQFYTLLTTCAPKITK